VGDWDWGRIGAGIATGGLSELTGAGTAATGKLPVPGAPQMWDPSKVPLVSNFVSDPREEKLKRDMAAAAAQTQAYRPQALDARLSAVRQALARYAPVSAALQQMYGPGASLNLTAANPFGQAPANILDGNGIADPNAPKPADGGKQPAQPPSPFGPPPGEHENLRVLIGGG
jgi:hypothetical protein